MSFDLDKPSTEDILQAVLSSSLPSLPPHEASYGPTTVSWWETDPGEVYIHAEGGTTDDRHYASTLVGIQLAPHGYRRAQFDPDAWLQERDPKGVVCPQCGKDYIHALGRDGKSAIGCGSCGYRAGLDDLEGMVAERPVQVQYKLPIIDPSTNNLGPRHEGSAAPEPPSYRPATTKDNCGGCKMFDKGRCWGYANKEVEEDHVCDSFAPEVTHSSRVSNWVDLMQKAKRLIQSGQVHVLRNGYNYIVGHIVGDHGEYDTEISRDDPTSRSITGWQCSCPWDQYAWQRTRKWKKFEGRPCSHVMGLYWKALSTPLDEQLTPEQQAQMGTGQKLTPPAPAVPEHPPEIEDRMMKGERPPEQAELPRSFSPEGEIIQGDQLGLGLPPDAVGGPAQSPLAPPPTEGPQPSGILPPFPGEQMEMQWAGPGTTPGGQQSPPGAYTVPGAKPQTPANPIQNPSTYSKVAADDRWAPGLAGKGWLTPEGALHTWATYNDARENDVDGFPSHMDQMVPLGFPDHMRGRDPTAAIAEGYFPLVIYPDGTAYNSWAPDNSFPEEARVLIHARDPRIRFPHGGRMASDIKPPAVVRLKKPAMGIAEGPVKGQYGDGGYVDIPEGSTGEVLSQDSTTGWLEVIFPLDQSGEHEPYHARCYLEASEVEPTSQTNAFIRRHTSTGGIEVGDEVQWIGSGYEQEDPIIGEVTGGPIEWPDGTVEYNVWFYNTGPEAESETFHVSELRKVPR